jgi:hypothetical protein
MMPGREKRALVALMVLAGATLFLASCSLFNLRPTASFALPERPRPGAEAVFVNTSTDPNGFEDLRQFIWEFGDGATASSQNATHMYLQAGTYTVRLTVIDSCQNADTCQQDLDVRSRVFALPDRDDAVMGKQLSNVGGRTVINEVNRYHPAQGGGPFVVSYPVTQVAPGRWALLPQNVVGWLPLRFATDLDQPVELALRWEMRRENGEPLSPPVQYTYATTYALSGPGLAVGVDLAWDLWNDVEAMDGEPLPKGRYYARLRVDELLSGEVFVWDFPFIVDWGGL